jgi:hypothetical protein
MSLKLLQEAVLKSKYSDTKNKTITTLEHALGKEQARRIVEAYQVSEDDYDKWLDVIAGYARDEGYKLSKKADFSEIAGGVLENDPAPIDQDMQAAIINTLWAKYKAQQSHSKVQKVVKAREEEEQLKYALKRMKKSSVEDEEFNIDDDYDDDAEAEAIARALEHLPVDKSSTPVGFHSLKHGHRISRKGTRPIAREEEESEFSQLFRSAQEDEEWDDDWSEGGSKFQSYDPFMDSDDAELDDEWGANDFGEDDTRGRRWDQEDEEFGDDEEDPRQFGMKNHELASNDDFDIGGAHADNEYDDLDDEDHDIIDRGSRMKRDQDMDDFDFASDEGMDHDEQITSRGRRMEKDQDLDDWDAAEEDEEFEYDQAGNGSYLNHKSDGPRDRYTSSGDKNYLYDEEDDDADEYDASGDADYRFDRKDNGPARYSASGDKNYLYDEDEESAGVFKKGQLVICKKDGKTYRVEVPNGPGDYTGILAGNRINMVRTKDLTKAPEVEDEESTSKQSKSTKVSFLHDLLTGENSTDHMKKLQDEIETEAHNEWMKHHARMKKNPHPKGSIAYKAWEKGIKGAASSVWAPKPIFDTTKPKVKPKKKK